MSSTNKASPDFVILATVGRFLISELVELTTFSIIYGVFALLFAQSTLIFIREHLSSHAHMRMFLISACSFILAMLQGAALLVDACSMAQSTLIGHQGIPLDDRFQLAILTRRTPVLLMVWTSALGPIISDSVVVWRAFVLLKLQRKSWVIIVPLLLLLGSISMSLGNAILASTGDDIYSGLANTTFLMGIRLSLAANVLATTLFSYVYWRATVGILLGRYEPTRMVRVLAIFMESGVAFCVPQAIYVILVSVPQHLSHSTGEYIQDFFVIAYFAFALIYPTVVINLVNRRYTLDQYLSDASLLSVSGRNEIETLRPMTFAPPEPTVNARRNTEQDEISVTFT